MPLPPQLRHELDQIGEMGEKAMTGRYQLRTPIILIPIDFIELSCLLKALRSKGFRFCRLLWKALKIWYL